MVLWLLLCVYSSMGLLNIVTLEKGQFEPVGLAVCNGLVFLNKGKANMLILRKIGFSDLNCFFNKKEKQNALNVKND